MTEHYKTRFTGDSDDEVSSSFYTHLGSENAWFANLLYLIKKEWINKGYPVSDILIREGTMVLVAAIKTYVPFVHKEVGIPTRTSISNTAACFTKIDKEMAGKVYEFSFVVEGLGIFRVSYSGDEQGVGMAIRYLTFNLPDIDKMQYPEHYKSFIKGLVSKSTIKTPKGMIDSYGVRSGGLILHVGSTGSGKSTSIASEVGYLAEKITGAIVTYEAPIEYRYTATKAPVRQYEIGVSIKETEDHTVFENIKRHLLRNNPSVVVFGEARTNAEIREVLDAAARGHLVFATIHASTVMEALTTLMSVTKDDPRVLANVLQALVAHKLLINKKGEIVPIYEILTPEGGTRAQIEKQDLKAIGSSFVKESSDLRNSITFTRALANAAKEGKFTPEEVKTIRESSYGSF